jgi:hypothetical protein
VASRLSSSGAKNSTPSDDERRGPAAGDAAASTCASKRKAPSRQRLRSSGVGVTSPTHDRWRDRRHATRCAQSDLAFGTALRFTPERREKAPQAVDRCTLASTPSDLTKLAQRRLRQQRSTERIERLGFDAVLEHLESDRRRHHERRLQRMQPGDTGIAAEIQTGSASSRASAASTSTGVAGRRATAKRSNRSPIRRSRRCA